MEKELYAKTKRSTFAVAEPNTGDGEGLEETHTNGVVHGAKHS
jgi:hypothetical protein